jgi:hypothetical protein
MKPRAESSPGEEQGPERTEHRRGGRFLSREWLITALAVIFVASFLVGFLRQRLSPNQGDEVSDRAKSVQIEKLFGPYRASVRDGQAAAMAVCAAMVFGLNLLGCILRSIASLFILPAVVSLFSTDIGSSVASLHGSSCFSVGAFLIMCGLEWSCYVLSAAAGANVGLAFILPRLKCGNPSRWGAVKQDLRESRQTYLLIAVVLGVQAVTEICYVRQVLLHGGSGVPLLPY